MRAKLAQPVARGAYFFAHKVTQRNKVNQVMDKKELVEIGKELAIIGLSGALLTTVGSSLFFGMAKGNIDANFYSDTEAYKAYREAAFLNGTTFTP